MHSCSARSASRRTTRTSSTRAGPTEGAASRRGFGCTGPPSTATFAHERGVALQSDFTEPEHPVISSATGNSVSQRNALRTVCDVALSCGINVDPKLETEDKPNLDFHSLRHTFASAMIKATKGDAEKVRRRTGHADIKGLLERDSHEFESARGGRRIEEDIAEMDVAFGGHV